MGPMGPMMGGGNGAAGSLVLALAVLLIVALALAAFTLWRNGGTSTRRPRAPEETLRDRYARGELSREQYQEALVDILKDRYVRGELELEEYQARVEHLLNEPLGRRARELESGDDQLSASDGRRSRRQA